MTGAEAIESFNIHFDRVTSFSAPGYLTAEILLFLNNAQDQFIKDRAFGKNFQPPAFEDNQKRVVDLAPLLARQTITSGVSLNTAYGSHAYTVAKSAVQSGRVLYTLGVEARVTRTNPTISAEYIKCDPMKTEYIGKFFQSATNRTHHVYPMLVETNNNWIIIGDYYTSLIDRAIIEVMRRPYPITAVMAEYNTTYAAGYMNLDPSVHQEIVDIAVHEAFLAISDQRYQAKTSQEQMNTN